MGRGKRGKGWPRHVDDKRKHPPRPPSEDFGDSEYSEEVSSEYDRSPALASPVTSSQDSNDSMGLSTAARAYWRSIEHAGLGGSNDSEEVEDSSDSEEWSGGKDDDNSGDDEGKGDGNGEGGDGDGDGDGDSKGDGKGDGSSKGDDKGGSDSKGDDGGDGKASGIMPLA
jgi:hypothetical protein